MHEHVRYFTVLAKDADGIWFDATNPDAEDEYAAPRLPCRVLSTTEEQQ